MDQGVESLVNRALGVTARKEYRQMGLGTQRILIGVVTCGNSLRVNATEYNVDSDVTPDPTVIFHGRLSDSGDNGEHENSFDKPAGGYRNWATDHLMRPGGYVWW